MREAKSNSIKLKHVVVRTTFKVVLFYIKFVY